MVPEAPLEQTENGRVPSGPGWYVLNARDARWYESEERGAICDLEGDHAFEQLGFNLVVLGPGQPMAMYHWEADQEDFLVLSGEALLLVQGAERTLRAWDLFHCPPETRHTIVGAGPGPCAIVATGARDRSTGEDWGGYPVEEVALAHDVGVEQETTVPAEAYARYPRRPPGPYREGTLPDL